MNISEITKSGIHFITEPIKLDSGSVVKAEPGARLVGAVRLKPDACERGVYVCDLKAAGIEPAGFVSRGFGRSIRASHSELFINSRPMNVSQYPKAGSFLRITGFGEPESNEWDSKVGKLTGGFYYEDEHPKSWKKGQQIWTHGYWAWDWSPSRERVETLDTERGFVMNAEPYGQYSFIKGQRFYFFNIIEEVTEPGDYCIDFESGKLYFKPFDGTDIDSAEILLSMCDKPVFELDGAKDITIDGFIIEGFRGNAIKIDHSENIKISGCEIRNVGNRGVVVDNSKNVIVSNCKIHDTGDGGIALWCGSRETLEHAGCTVEDCEIYSVARWDRCYEPPVKLYGVGLSARRNYIHDCPHSAILFGGNDITIADNEVCRVVTETGDAGAIYGGRDYTMRGNVVEGNFIHHVGSGVGMGTMGIYNDDCLSGTVMRGNVFYKVQRAVFLGGGVDFVVEGNVFVDCTPSIEIDGRGQSDHKVWRNMVINTLYDRFYNICGKGIKATDPPYITKYPELAKLDKYYKENREPHIPPSVVMTKNVFCSEQKINYTWNTEGGDYVEKDSVYVDRDELKKYLTEHQYEVINS